MLISGHILAGFVAGRFLTSYFVVFIVGVFSHYLLDAVPHNEPSGKNHHWSDYFDLMVFVALDILGGLMIGLYLIWGKDIWLPLFGGFAAILPDLIDNAPWSKHLRRYRFFQKSLQVHQFFHYKHEDRSRALGYIQYVVMGLMIWLLLKS